MKKFIFLFLTCFSHFVLSQNLVPNYSFEEYSTCPNFINQFYKLQYWYNPTTASPDYFNSCSNPSLVGVPNNFFGIQNAYSGNGYIGLGIYSGNVSNYREYVQVELIEPLEVNKKYKVSYFVNLADTFKIASSEISALITINSFYVDTNINLNFIPQITNEVIITDKINWVKITGSYLANGGEKFLTLGNFNNDFNTQIVYIGDSIISPNFEAYYYIDDVYVGLDSTVNINTEAPSKKEEITLYPNPANENVFIKTENSKPAEMFVYNMQGCLMLRQRFTKNTNINLQDWPAGVYYVKIVSENGIFVRKFAKEE
ncbi:MAG TPA: hypothetical protein DEH02_08665 [Bacteroidales bacterium]|nr:MAG: hypothetical protein A2X01_03395 [Bacteroidetes bacterium GWF2_35_48]HBX51122.1 hypothetical protein [Bacteroidales bacterium]